MCKYSYIIKNHKNKYLKITANIYYIEDVNPKKKVKI